jgi:hypothetical protein
MLAFAEDRQAIQPEAVKKLVSLKLGIHLNFQWPNRPDPQHRNVNITPSMALVRHGVVPAPALPSATPAERLQSEFHIYLQQERAVAPITQAHYLMFLGEFLAERFGGGPAVPPT